MFISETSLCDKKEKLHGFIDDCLSCGPGKLFLPIVYDKPKQKKVIQSFCVAINDAIAEIKLQQLTGNVAGSSCQLYDAMAYKFGPSNRHQKFWRSAMQIYRELKNVNKKNLLTPFETLSSKMESSGFCYRPTKTFVNHLGALILERIYCLDRIRFHCSRSASLSMGYVEIGHLLTFNLMSIAIASDVAHEAIRHIRGLINIYNRLAEWLRRCSENFPKKFDEFSLHSAHQLQEQFERNPSKKRTKSRTIKDLKKLEQLLKLNDIAKEHNSFVD